MFIGFSFASLIIWGLVMYSKLWRTLCRHSMLLPIFIDRVVFHSSTGHTLCCKAAVSWLRYRWCVCVCVRACMHVCVCVSTWKWTKLDPVETLLGARLHIDSSQNPKCFVLPCKCFSWTAHQVSFRATNAIPWSSLVPGLEDCWCHGQPLAGRHRI